ncbi:MAG: hypothetical protein R2798_08885 [Chitinophagales bacterium]|nr:hypothetical protein [Bacteroidota bacterium]MCB9043931.1 hypothetical protein [Chitinophagales bacterium]
MRNLYLLFLLSLLFFSCKKDRNGCAYYTGFPKANVISSYPPFDAYANFRGNDITNTSISVYTINMVEGFCTPHHELLFAGVDASNRDTIKLYPFNINTGNLYAKYFVLNLDATAEIYTLVEDSIANNWLLIEDVYANNKMMRGKFSCTYVTEVETFLNGEYERWDDPNRPDTIHFEGSFTARKE